MKTRAALSLLALACACGTQPERPDPAAAQAHAAAVAAAEARAAVAVVGTRVCRRLTAGIGNYDWIDGVVVAVEGDTVTVRIDNSGRMSHTVDGIAVKSGVKLSGNPMLWTPCR